MDRSLDAPSTGFLGWVALLARDHSARLAGSARAEGLSADDALDAAQEAFHAFLLLPQARTLVADGDARKLLLVLVRNVARNMRRRHHRAVRHEGLDEIGDLSASEEPPVDELIARAEEHVRFLGCVDRLAELQRRVVTLRMLEQVSGQEAATALGMAPGRVAVLLHRARKALEACLVR